MYKIAPVRTFLMIFAAASVLGPLANAQAPKHDSNTLHKIGNAIQYPIRKAGENTSVAAHMATGHNSVVRRRNGNRVHTTIVTPKGNYYRLHHHRHHRKVM